MYSKEYRIKMHCKIYTFLLHLFINFVLHFTKYYK